MPSEANFSNDELKYKLEKLAHNQMEDIQEESSSVAANQISNSIYSMTERDYSSLVKSTNKLQTFE